MSVVTKSEKMAHQKKTKKTKLNLVTETHKYLEIRRKLLVCGTGLRIPEETL